LLQGLFANHGNIQRNLCDLQFPHLATTRKLKIIVIKRTNKEDSSHISVLDELNLQRPLTQFPSHPYDKRGIIKNIEIQNQILPIVIIMIYHA
jgi:hypothetical protein|tara:strand:+ start:16150 stop:16428 length:279 start_codon:yes stop_codon:yes gene_type:complete